MGFFFPHVFSPFFHFAFWSKLWNDKSYTLLISWWHMTWYSKTTLPQISSRKTCKKWTWWVYQTHLDHGTKGKTSLKAYHAELYMPQNCKESTSQNQEQILGIKDKSVFVTISLIIARYMPLPFSIVDDRYYLGRQGPAHIKLPRIPRSLVKRNQSMLYANYQPKNVDKPSPIMYLIQGWATSLSSRSFLIVQEA